MRSSKDEEFSTERCHESSESRGDSDSKKVNRRKLGADKEMMHDFLSSVEFNPFRLRSRKMMHAMEMETCVSTKKQMKSRARLNEIDFKMVDLSDDYGPSIIGRRVEVYWPDSRRWFRGRVKAFDHQKMIHKIDYDDGDKERLDLRNEVFRMEVYPGESVNVKLPESNIKHKPKLHLAKWNEAENHGIHLGLQEKEGNTSSYRKSFPQVEMAAGDNEQDSQTCPGLENRKVEFREENNTNIYQAMPDIIIKPKDMPIDEGKLEAEDPKIPTKKYFERRLGKKQVCPSSEKQEPVLDQLTCTNYYVRRKRPITSKSL